MKNYKIDVFNQKKLKKNYNSSGSITNIVFHNIEEFIYELFNSEETQFKVNYKLYEQEIFLLTQNNDYITSDGYYYNGQNLNFLKENYIEETDKRGNIKYIDTTIKDYRDLEKENIGDLVYLSDKDIDIYLNIKAEKLYELLTNLGLEITGFSGNKKPKKQIDLASSVYKQFSFNINIPNKKEFIEKSIKLFESKIIIKGYTIIKLKEELLNKIKLLDEKYGTEGKNILIENKKKTSYFKYVLLILHLENKINILEYKDYNNKFYVDILQSKEIITKNYSIKDGNLIINNGELIIKLTNTEMVIMQSLRYSSEPKYLSDFNKHSLNPEAVIKKIRHKIKKSGIKGFNIKLKKDNLGDKEIQIIIGE